MIDNEKSHITLEDARKLVAALEQDNFHDANKLLEVASNNMHQELFEGVGKLTRQFHDSFTNMNMDERFSSIVNLSLPDAKERLQYVVELTADAANKTMDAVDECIPLAQKHRNTVREILPSWNRLKNCKIKADEFKLLRDKIDNYFDESINDAEALNITLNDIVLAQGYQDLTGQVLQKVSEMMRDVEEDLVGLLKLFGQYEAKEAKKPKEKIDNYIEAEGPIMPTVKEVTDVVSGQDDVDDLLSSLGF